MMNARGSSRIWLIGSVLAVVALVAAAYLLAIKPVYAEAETTRAQAGDAEMELVRLNKQLNDLRDKYENRQKFADELATKKLQLPDSYDVPNYLRQLQNTDKTVSIVNNSISVSDPVAVPGTANVVGVPISLSAEGKVPGLLNFVSRLQNNQPRAVLLNTVNLQNGDTNAPILSISLTAFCAKKEASDCQLNTIN